MFRSASFFIGTSFTVAVFTIYATSNVDSIVGHRQNKLSAQLPQPTRSQTGKPEEVEFRPQSHMVSLSGNLPIVQARDTLSRRSYQSIVLASLWWRLWSAAANWSNFNFWNAKRSIKQINCVHIKIFQNKGCWFKIRMEFLRPILVKI